MAEKIKKAENTPEKNAEVQKPKTTRKPKKIQEVYIEYNDKQINQKDIVNEAEALWVAEGNLKKDIVSTKVYIQPETDIVYFVINDTFYGSFEL